ncbi:hypothetical protein [Variovorax sp. CCNWLW235]|uniref:hypothetical protein n=1 Tax=Variovorax sp. CCNWLW235 TaxID=3127463 RepID=UPI003076961F
MLTNLCILRLHHQRLESRVPAFGRQRLADQLRQRLGEKRTNGSRRRHLKFLLPDANGLDRKGQGRIRAACRGRARIAWQGRHAVPARCGAQGGRKKGVGVLQFSSGFCRKFGWSIACLQRPRRRHADCRRFGHDEEH